MSKSFSELEGHVDGRILNAMRDLHARIEALETNAKAKVEEAGEAFGEAVGEAAENTNVGG